eukprot:9655155-Alexandrium_andersonii.AAC.1
MPKRPALAPPRPAEAGQRTGGGASGGLDSPLWATDRHPCADGGRKGGSHRRGGLRGIPRTRAAPDARCAGRLLPPLGASHSYCGSAAGL